MLSQVVRLRLLGWLRISWASWLISAKSSSVFLQVHGMHALLEEALPLLQMLQ